ncbi:MAG: N-acetylneuraminate synthase family protein [Pseudomonadota bacterium]
MSKELIISNLVISERDKPFVIAEIGINHNGSLEVAKEMVDSAHRAGALCVKHQTHIVEDEMSKAAKNVIPGNADISIYDIMASCALNEADEYALKQYVEVKGMIFLSTPFSRAAADRLESFDVPAYKIGSGECNNYPLIEHIAQFKKPMIISTGMNTLASIKKTVAIVEKYQTPFALLHTTNLYPTPAHLVRLGAMQELMRAFPHVLVGLSDHTVNNNACLAATALGACILERHFTDSYNRNGPDIVCSMDEKELALLLQHSAEIASMRGGVKEPAKEEQVTIDFAFATVVSIAPIQKGEQFTEKNIWVKRPGTGDFSAEEYPQILGKIATCTINSDEQITKSMVQ